jgi:hypothetical protein
MTNLTAFGELLAADTESRTLRYRLLPYGEPGRTSRGTVTIHAGVLELPTDPAVLHLNVEHDRTKPVAVCSALVEDESGLLAAFDVAPTRAGDDLLVEAGLRLRAGVSIELEDARIRDGHLTAGRLTGAGAVTAPAFPSALLVAADTDDPDPHDPGPVPPDALPVAPAPPTVDPPAPADPDDDDPEDPTVTETPTGTVATVPASLTTAARHAATQSLDEVMGRLTAATSRASLGDRGELEAALADIGVPTVTQAPAQWVGELWKGSPDRRVVPLLNHGTLTGLSVIGWEWIVPPTVGPWAGDKSAVPSNAATTGPVEVPAQRVAGAHDIPREHRDFNTGFIQSYYAAMTVQYGVYSDKYVADGVLAASTAIAGGTDAWSAIVAGALAVGENGSPSFALVASDVFAELAGVKAADAPAFLDLSLTFEGTGSAPGIRVVTVPGYASGTVVVGDKNAATVHELPGSPIRAEAIDMTKGGVDAGVFGYIALVVHDRRALVHSPITAAVTAGTKSK